MLKTIAKYMLAYVGLLESVTTIKNDFRRRPRQSKLDRLMNDKDDLLKAIESKEVEIELLKERITYYEGKPTYYLNKQTILPGIIFDAIQKSAGVFIVRTLAQSLDIEFREISMAHGHFPYYFVIPNSLERVRQGNMIRHEHFNTSRINIEVLSRYTDRLIVHLRDPRQATLSWMHHAERLHREHPDGFIVNIHFTFPDGYEDRTFEQRLDWHIDTQLRSIFEWISDWVAYANTGGKVKVLFTRYEDFLKDEQSFFRRILDFYDIPQQAFIYSPAEKTMAFHFREGRADEWGLYT